MRKCLYFALLVAFLPAALLTFSARAAPSPLMRWLPEGVTVAEPLYTGDNPATVEDGDPIVVTQKNTSGDVLYGLAGQDGVLVLSPTYSGIEPFSDGLARVMKQDKAGNQRFGFVDRDGVLKTPVEYRDAGSFSEGCAWFVKREGARQQVGFVDKNGKETFLPYLELGSLREGLARVTGLDGEGNKKYGYVLKTGRTLVPPRFDGAEDFCEGMARVMQLDASGNKKYGFLDRDGKLAIPLEYDAAEPFSEGLALVMKQGAGWGFVDKTGNIVVPLAYTGAGSFSEGFAPVVGRDESGNKKYGFVNSSGSLAIPLRFDYVSGFSNGFAIVMRLNDEGKEKYGFVNKNGILAVNCDYDSALLFSEDRALVTQLRADGSRDAFFIDKTGSMVLPLDYSGVRSFQNGYARIINFDSSGNRRYGFIDTSGGVVLPAEYRAADLFQGSVRGYAVNESGRCALFELPPAEHPVEQVAGPQSPMAYPAAQTVEVDGKPMEFHMYAVIDENGNPTNYVRLRDIAYVLNGTAAQFGVSWKDGSVIIENGKSYISNGSEMRPPFSGERPYVKLKNPTLIDGEPINLTAILLTSDTGGGYTYYRLRTLGKNMGFNVGWSKERGVYVETGRDYELVVA